MKAEQSTMTKVRGKDIMRKNEYTHFLAENIRGKTLPEYSIAGYCGRLFSGKRSRFNLISGKAMVK
jgi:hypothetical protein